MSRRARKIVSRKDSRVQKLLAKLLETIKAKMPLERTGLEDILNRMRDYCIALALNEARWNYALAAQLIGVSPKELRKDRWKKRGKRRTGPIPPRPKDRGEEE